MSPTVPLLADDSPRALEATALLKAIDALADYGVHLAVSEHNPLLLEQLKLHLDNLRAEHRRLRVTEPK